MSKHQHPDQWESAEVRRGERWELNKGSRVRKAWWQDSHLWTYTKTGIWGSRHARALITRIYSLLCQQCFHWQYKNILRYLPFWTGGSKTQDMSMNLSGLLPKIQNANSYRSTIRHNKANDSTASQVRSWSAGDAWHLCSTSSP